MRKKSLHFRFILPLTLSLLLALSACGSGSGDNSAASEDTDATSVTASEGQDSQASPAEGAEILIAYFSWSGNTRQLAEEIQAQTGGTLFEIQTATAYADDYDTLLDQAQREQNEQARPVLSTHVEELDRYDTVLLGYPIWWGDMPMALYSFLEEYDLSGKTLVPFVTSGGSGLSGTPAEIQALEPDATVLEGLSVPGSEASSAQDQVRGWLAQNALS